jgi:hypothetical protein
MTLNKNLSIYIDDLSNSGRNEINVLTNNILSSYNQINHLSQVKSETRVKNQSSSKTLS